MKEKYITEEFGIFYDDAGSIFYRLNTHTEKEIDVSSLDEESIKTIVSEHKRLLCKILELNKKYDIKNL